MRTFSLRKIGNPLHTVGGKLFFIYFVSITLMVGGIGYFSYIQSSEAIQEKVAESAKQTIRLAADKVEKEIKSYLDVTMQLIADTDLMQWVRDYYNPEIAGYDHYRRYSQIEKKLSSVTLWKEGIRNITVLPLSSEKGITGNNYSGMILRETPVQETWFQQVVKENGWAVFLPTREKGYYAADKPSFAISRLMVDTTTGKKIGVLLLEIDAEVLDKALGDLSMGKARPVVVLDPENHLIRAKEKSEIGKPFEIPITAEERDKGLTQSVSFTRAGKLVIYKTMKESGWTVAAAVPVADLLRESEQIRNVAIFMALGAMLIAVLIGLWVLRMVGNPLNRLKELMREAEKGNLTVRMEARGKDEIGEVGRSYNHMMEKIASLIQASHTNASSLMERAEELLKASKETAASAQEMARATEEIAKGAMQLALEAEQGTRLTHEMRQKMEEVEKASRIMDASVREVEEASFRGTSYMAELRHKTIQTEEMTQRMVEKIDRLGQNMGSIKEILEIMQSITKQTNILSLNASIEAARAGEVGKGFAVVADEIRRLAEQSRQSIDVVGEITSTIEQDLQETLDVVRRAAPLYREQISAVKGADLLFTQVREKMSQLAVRLAEVTGSLERLKESQKALIASMENVGSFSEESSASSEEVAFNSQNQREVSEALVKMSEKLEGLSRDMQANLSFFQV
ncbi:methyl-accepting chemotaxis protein [Thermicanus aegyptius]|uniref:methyl-accepting chemotaxis protein n=1 Tax=Thermicanus aegyptius TaxID=94009 RepID=UPI0004236BC0|nr:methyl-accepting chemotaxis protein [Thermicanus aegyptius]